jgi:hypothetical protein
MVRHFLKRRAGRTLSPWTLKQVQGDDEGQVSFQSQPVTQPFFDRPSKSHAIVGDMIGKSMR